MAVKIANFFAFLDLDDKSYKSKMDAAEGRASSFSKTVNGFLERVGQRAFDALVTGLETVATKMRQAVVDSSNLNETINKTGVVFGSSAQEIIAWSQTTDTAMGLSQRAALDATGKFGALFRQMGQGPQAAVGLSENLVQIAADLGSIYNIDIETALEKLQSGLIGEIRPLRDVNIFLNENVVAQRAVQLGLASSTDAVSDQAKVMARYSLIVDGAKIAQGDFARTSGGLANAQRIVAAELENGSARLGNTFRPAVEAITATVADLAPQMFGYAQNITDQFANGLAAGIRAIIPVITAIRQLFTYWFAPGSPPRVLPDIAKWGAETMQVYLDSFSSVDVKGAFDTVGRAIETILRSSVAAGKSSEGGLVSAIFGTRTAITQAVAEFAKAGSVSAATINRISQSAGAAGPSIAALVRAYFNLQAATTATTRAQESLNRITEKYDAILNPLRSQLDAVRGEQQRLANQQRLIAAQNILTSFESTAAEKRAAQLDIEQIQIEQQISTTEDQKKAETDKAQAAVDSATKQETAAKKQLDIAQATIDQQVETNNLLGEQKRLVEQLAAAQEAAAKKAEAAAEAAANKATAAAEKAQREAEQLAAAQLRYNLQISDTAGDISIMEGELAKLTPGTVEYFNVLTQLDSLHKQYNKELEAAAKAASKIGETDISAGLTAGVITPLGETSKAGENLALALKEAFAPIGPASEATKSLAESLSGLTQAMGLLFGIDFSSWLNSNKAATDRTEWDMYGQAVETNATTAQQSADSVALAMKKSADDTTLTLRTLRSDYEVIMDILNGDWEKFWIDWAENVRLGNEAANRNNEAGQSLLSKNMAQWLTDTAASIGRWLDDVDNKFVTGFESIGKSLYTGGANAVNYLWDGMQSKWNEVESWFTDKLAALRAQLPFSEPKDPASPLRGLAKSGEAMVNMIQGGIDKASFNVQPLASGLVPAFAGNTNNASNYGPFEVSVTINGNANEADVRRGVAGGLNDVLTAFRARGNA